MVKIGWRVGRKIIGEAGIDMGDNRAAHGLWYAQANIKGAVAALAA